MLLGACVARHQARIAADAYLTRLRQWEARLGRFLPPTHPVHAAWWEAELELHRANVRTENLLHARRRPGAHRLERAA